MNSQRCFHDYKQNTNLEQLQITTATNLEMKHLGTYVLQMLKEVDIIVEYNNQINYQIALSI